MPEHNSDSLQKTQVESVNTESVNASRRKLTAAALASPVILGTLVSKQALGDVLYDCTISGKLSNNQSSHGGVDNCKIGKSPGYWKNHPTAWTYGFARGNKFNKPLAAGTFNNQYPKLDGTSKTFGEVLDLTGGAGSAPYEALGREAVATLLNAYCYAPNFPLTPQQVVTIFNTTVSAGQYIPQPGATPWTPEMVKDYFLSLHE